MCIDQLLKLACGYDEVYIYSARIVAGTVYYFFSQNNVKVKGFVVTKKEFSDYLDMPLYEIGEIKNKSALIVVSTIECYHEEIKEILNKLNFHNYLFVSDKLRDEMVLKLNTCIDVLEDKVNLSEDSKILKIFMAKGHFDKKLTRDYDMPNWLVPIQVGSNFTEDILCDIRDNTGDNISYKNKNYCELTATYWIWKNITVDYVGLCHYRRHFNLNEKLIDGIIKNNIDVLLPIPVVCLPNANEHHKYYISESDFEAMLEVLKDFYPDYYNASKEVFSEKLFYWHNMWIMKKEHLDDYCSWLFDILEKIEKKVDLDNTREDRYVGYLAESLTTLYFRYNKNRLKISHVSEKMLI